jgi:type IV pilus biogenesis protein CpaD/CtpE
MSSNIPVPAIPDRSRPRFRTASVLAAASLMLRDARDGADKSVIVGAVPDDYRTNHPDHCFRAGAYG